MKLKRAYSPGEVLNMKIPRYEFTAVSYTHLDVYKRQVYTVLTADQVGVSKSYLLHAGLSGAAR